MTDHEALEALVKIAGEIPISAYPGKSYDERSHNAVTMVETLIDLSKALRTGQLIPAPSVETVARAIANADLDGPDPEDYWQYLATAAISAMQVKP